MRLKKVTFDQLNDKQKIMVMRDMIDFFAKDQAYVEKKADIEWTFEVVDLSEKPEYVIHKDKAIATNLARQEARKNWVAFAHNGKKFV